VTRRSISRSGPGHRPATLPHLGAEPSLCLQRIERLPWKVGAAFDLHGAKVGVRVSDPAVWPRVLAVLPPGTRVLRSVTKVDHIVSWLVGTGPRARRRRRHALFANGRLLARTGERRVALETLERHLERAVAEMSPRRLCIHAGVVGIGRRAVVIPGRSGSGKTFLVRTLVERGATLYSDEYALLDCHGRVHPYPRALRVHGGAGTRRLTPERLGASVGTKPLRVGQILVTEHVKGARWHPRPASPGRGLLALFRQAVHVRYRARRALPVLARVASRATVIESPRGEARAVADWLLASEGEGKRR